MTERPILMDTESVRAIRFERRGRARRVEATP